MSNEVYRIDLDELFTGNARAVAAAEAAERARREGNVDDMERMLAEDQAAGGER
jgi:hypothetical protein